MKTLINKKNPQIRITAPEIETGTGYYYVGSVGYYFKAHWTLVEEEPAEDWREKRKKECPFRRNLDNNLYGCERYADVVCACDGNCSWVVDYPKLKEIQDKIYLPSRFNLIDALRVRKSDSDVEYIRKDVILEWANNMKRICKGAEPIEKAYQTMVEKIESL